MVFLLFQLSSAAAAVSEASIIDLVGEFQDTITVTGQPATMLTAAGNYQPTIEITGEME